MTSPCISGRAQRPGGWCLGALALLVAVLGLSGPASAGTPGQIDPGFEAPAVNGRIFSVAVQPDGKILIGGTFTEVDGQPRTSVARLNADGSLDGTFSPPLLFRQVQAIALQPDGRVLIGGNVLSADRDALIRLNANGSIDEGFVDPGLLRPGDLDGVVESITLQPDGKIVIGGNFTKVGGVDGESREQVARLNADGTIDLGFGSPVPGAGPNGIVESVALLPDDKVLIGGDFTSVGGVARERAARLGDSGTLDELFVNPLIANAVGAGGTPIVEAIVPQPDGKVLIGGGFTRVGGQADPENVRGGAARLEAEGTLDEDFVTPFFGGVVNSVVLQTDGAIPLGGAFLEPEPGRGNHLSRLEANGSLDTSFTSPFTNAFSSVDSLALQPDGKLVFSVVDSSSSPTVYEVARLLNTSPQGAPTSISANAGDRQATVSWTAVPGEITEYSVTANSGGQTCTTSGTSCTVTGLNNGTPYSFTVTAENGFGPGPISSPSASVTPQPPTFQLSVAKSGTGSGTVASTPTGIDCGSACSGSFVQGTSVTLTATAASGSTFTGWGGACSGAGSCEVAMSEARSVTASFAKGSPPVPPGGPMVGVLSAKAQVSKKSVLITSRIKVSVKGKISQRATTGKGSKARIWCNASRNVPAAGTYTLQCNLGGKGRKALRKGNLKLTLRTTFTTTGEAVTRDRNLALKRRR